MAASQAYPVILSQVHPANSMYAFPAELCNILVPDVYLSMATAHPDRVFAWIMDGDHDDCPIESITWERLQSDSRLAASDLLMSGVHEKERAQPEAGPIGFLLDSNYKFYVYQVAAWLLGRSVVLLSPRNSAASIRHLLQACNAQDLLVDDRHMHVIEELKALPDLNIVKITGVFPGHLRQYVRLSPTAEEVAVDMDRPALYLHSSGSTGLPKLISASHRHVLNAMRVGLGCPYVGDTLYGPLPLSHGLGYGIYTLYPLGSGVIPVFLSSKSPLSADSVIRHLERLPQCIALLPPAILEDLANLGDSAIRILARNTKRTIYAGAPLRKACGQTLVDHGVKLVTGYGMSELPTPVVMDIASQNLKDDWMYIRFHDCYKTHFIPVDSESNVYELVASAGSSATPVVINHDNPRGFSTGDLWTPHPTIGGLWRHMGRKDSMIALSNGLKVNTKEIENMLLEDPRIYQLLVFGAGRFLIGVIVVPTHSENDQERFIDAIWPTVQKVNTIVPSHMRLLRGMVLVASPSKPFVTTDKNSVKYKETLSLYAEEIEFVYSNLATVASCDRSAETLTRTDVLSFIRNNIEQVAGRVISDDVNFFEYGIDSLQAIQIWSRLRRFYAPFAPAMDAEPSFSTAALYRNPTISKLASFTLAQASGAAQEFQRDPCEHINTLVDVYSSDFPHHMPPPTLAQDPEGHVFLVTGTTGAFGSHLLISLLRQKDVRKIFCLNRPSSASIIQRQSDSLEQYGVFKSLQDEVDSGRIVFLDAALAEEDLELSSVALTEIRSTVTHIIHNAWQLNFNLTLDNFAAHIAGVRSLVDLALSSHRLSPPFFIFISSVGAVSDYPGAVPEMSLNDPAIVAGQTGYSQSKYVAERIIDRASVIAGLPSFIVRCGQLSGSTVNGAWKPQEFIPILLRSSFEIGTIPDHFPDLCWIPVNIAGEIVVNLSIQGTADLKTSSSATYWHLENPEATAWSEMVERVVACGHGVRPVSTTEWLGSLTRLSSSANIGQQLPAAATLVDFYRQYATSLDGKERTKLDTTSTVRACPQLGSVGSATQWMDKYIRSILSV